MKLALLLPAALAALGALLLPLLIHLARRSQMVPTPFAALRWLRRTVRPQRRLRLEEWPLLLLRVLLLALLALWLARPVLYSDRAAAGWTVAVPGVDAEQVRALAADTDPPRWLAPGFPPLEQPVTQGSLPVASLLRQLDAELPPETALVVAVPERLDGMDAERPRLSRPVAWHVLSGAMPVSAAAAPEPPVLHVRHDAAGAGALRYLRAAVAAWHGGNGMAEERLSVAPTAVPLAADTDYLVWLAAGPVPAQVLDWVGAGGIVLFGADAQVEFPAARSTWWRDAGGEALVEGAPLGDGRMLRFTRALEPAQMSELLEPGFPRRLREVLQGPHPVPGRVAAVDHAPLVGGGPWPRPGRELRPWLALLVALVFLAERWMATSRRRLVAGRGRA